MLSSAMLRRLQPSHVMQVVAQCLLVEEAYGVRPPITMPITTPITMPGMAVPPATGCRPAQGNAPARHHARFDQGWPVRPHHIPASGVKGGSCHSTDRGGIPSYQREESLALVSRTIPSLRPRRQRPIRVYVLSERRAGHWAGLRAARADTVT